MVPPGKIASSLGAGTGVAGAGVAGVCAWAAVAAKALANSNSTSFFIN